MKTTHFEKYVLLYYKILCCQSYSSKLTQLVQYDMNFHPIEMELINILFQRHEKNTDKIILVAF